MILNKKIYSSFVLSSAVLLAGCSTLASSDEASIAIDVVGYEFGPAVPKVVVSLDETVTAIDDSELVITTAGVEREVEAVYLSDENGNQVEGESQHVTIQVPVTYSFEDSTQNASPFSYSMETFQNTWVEDYTVKIENLKVTTADGEQTLSLEENAIDNRISLETAVFNARGEFKGEYTNPLTQETEELSLNYAAYEPDSIADGEQNPLVIWLHGQGEGGTDPDITLLGNEVVALAREEIQSYFTAGEETGAYVLAVQTPTYWMDEGDGTNGAGAGVSRYTEILMDTIQTYVESNPDIDTNRIYLTGGSNGGYMTLNMAIHYPDYFAALVPQAAAYSYYDYERNEDGTYKVVEDENSLSGTAHVKTEDVYFDEEKVSAISQIPMWFIHAANDTVVVPENYSLPIYKAVIEAGATNAWYSYFESAEGSDLPGTSYLGHWSWTYFFNNKVTGVQDPNQILEASDLSGFTPDNASQGGTAIATLDGVTYSNVFEWLNAQSR